MNGNPDHTSDAIDTWEIWNKFRMLCHHHCKLSVAIELTEDLPTTAELDRWLAEPIKLITIPSRIFQTGRRGQPSLSQAHVSFLRKLFKVRQFENVIAESVATSALT
jgi:protein arginine N-methyltransferase 5